jgi:hypothetical protein
MTDELLDAHGLPRREFLKKAAIGAFVAPVIVSFGLGATAEAGTAQCPNQTIANQRALQIGNIVITIWNRQQDGLITRTFASRLRAELLTAERFILDGYLRYACNQLDLVQRQLANAPTGSIDVGTANNLGGQVKNVWTQAGCASC